MKISHKIFSVFNLLIFIGSFCFTISLYSFAISLKTQDQSLTQKQFSAKQDVEDSGCGLSWFEKNENENEDGIQITALLLPFFVSYLQFEIFEIPSAPTKLLAVKYTNPIYLSVCNFRV